MDTVVIASRLLAYNVLYHEKAEDAYMAMEEKPRRTGAELPNNLILESREHLSISGVADVESFDENLVSMETSEGMLTVRGSGLHVEKLNLENGELALAGEITSLEYEDRAPARGGLFAKLFG